MILGEQQPFNELQILRQSNPLSQRQKLITGIFDRRIKQISKLDSKQQILSQCQQLLISKVLDYMNQLDLFDQKYLKQAQAYTQRLQTKEALVIKLQKTLNFTKNQLQQLLNKYTVLQKDKQSLTSKVSSLLNQNQSLLIQQKKDQTVIANNKIALKQLQQDNFTHKHRNVILNQQIIHLNKEIEKRVEEIKEVNVRMKDQGLKLWNENYDKIEEMKKVMDEEIGKKNKEINELEKEKKGKKELRVEKLERVVVRPVGGKEKGDVLTNKKVVESLRYEDKADIIIEQNQVVGGVRNYEEHNNNINFKKFTKINASPSPLLSITDPISSPTFIISQNNNINNNQQIHQQNNTAKKDDTWKALFKKQFVTAFSQLYKISNDIKNLANQRIILFQTQKNEIQDILITSPSKDQDIQKISQLMQQNQHLILRVRQQQQRAQSAYQAMRITKQQLKRVIQNIPFQIYNSTLGRSASSKILPHSQRSKSGQRILNIIDNSFTTSTTITNSKQRRLKKKSDLSSNDSFLGPSCMNLNKYSKYQRDTSFCNLVDNNRRQLKSALN